MAKTNRKGRTQGEGRFVMLHHYILKSDAWQSLTPQDRAVFVELMMIYDGQNNGYLGFSVRRAAARCNINKDTATACFARLVERGFIERTQKGTASQAGAFSNEWRLTSQKCNRTGHAGSRAFLRWTPEKILRPKSGDNSVRFKGTALPGDPETVRFEGTEADQSDPTTVPNQGTHIYLAIGTAAESRALITGISDDDREARAPQRAVAGGRRRGGCTPSTGPERITA